MKRAAAILSSMKAPALRGAASGLGLFRFAPGLIPVTISALYIGAHRPGTIGMAEFMIAFMAGNVLGTAYVLVALLVEEMDK